MIVWPAARFYNSVVYEEPKKENTPFHSIWCVTVSVVTITLSPSITKYFISYSHQRESKRERGMNIEHDCKIL